MKRYTVAAVLAAALVLLPTLGCDRKTPSPRNQNKTPSEPQETERMPRRLIDEKNPDTTNINQK